MLSTQKFVNQNCFDEGFPSDNPGLARSSYVYLFQDSRTQWSTLKYVDKNVFCWYLFLSKTSWIVAVMKLKAKNIIFSRVLVMELQIQGLIFLIKSLWQALKKSNNK